ncbi:MAG: hypothetical protein JWM68_4162 [Verrucomicrobiales bacterium]|nr:hypothetical protein [Verrucomicrobiales bacterium]
MKKIAILIVCAAAIVAGYIFLAPPGSTSKTGTVAQKETISKDWLPAKLSANKAFANQMKGADPAPAINVLLDNLWAASLENNQPRVQQALKNLTDYLAAHPEAMSTVLDVFKSETDEKKLSLLMPILTDYENPEGRKLITEAALELAQHDALPAKRQMGLSLMTKATPVDEACLQAIAQISKNDANNLVRITAIDIMNVWLTENPGWGDKLIGGLSAAIESSNDDTVRGRALQVLAQQNAQLPEAILKSVAQCLTTTNADNRIAAVMVLGEAADDAKSYALNQLESAFRQEASLPVKRDILVQLVRVGKAQATEILQRLPNNSDTAQDIIDFLKIIQDGKTTSLDEIYQQKFSLEGERERVAATTPGKPAEKR